MDYYQIIFEKTAAEKQEMLIALLDDIGFEGFEEEELNLKAFIPIDKFDQNLFNDVIEKLVVTHSKSFVQEINWNQRWESGFEPVTIPNPVTGEAFASVRANFHAVIEAVPYDLLVTPKMSFGTGHHATTYLMIQQMSQLDFQGKQVIDFGTGTAVLAILAEKLGASAVTAIDNDDWSINNARENIAANNCNKIKIVREETIKPGLNADIVLANINLNIIIANLDAIKAACKPGTKILFSGIMLQDEDEISMILEANYFSIQSCISRDNWLIILANG